MAAHLIWPLPNVWLGVTAEDQGTADARIPALLATPATVRFVSCEPMLSEIEIDLWLHRSPSTAFLTGKVTKEMPDWTRFGSTKLDWVICGGESGPNARPMHPDWARSLRDQCAAAGVPFFFKQWGEWKDGSDFAPNAHVVMNDRRMCEFGSAALVDMDRARSVLPTNPTLMRRVGKARAGRLLDGDEHNGVPGGVS